MTSYPMTDGSRLTALDPPHCYRPALDETERLLAEFGPACGDYGGR